MRVPFSGDAAGQVQNVERRALGEFDLATLGDDVPPREQNVRTDVVLRLRVVSAVAKPRLFSGRNTVQQTVQQTGDGVRVRVGEKTTFGLLVPVAGAPRLGREPFRAPRFLSARRRRVLDAGYLPGRNVLRPQMKFAVPRRSVRRVAVAVVFSRRRGRRSTAE